MKTNTKKWLYGLGSATIGGGAAAITSGISSMGIAPDKFNLQNASGFMHLMEMVIINFLFSGMLSAVFYLRQSPLPPESFIETTSESAVSKNLQTGEVISTAKVTEKTTTPATTEENKNA